MKLSKYILVHGPDSQLSAHSKRMVQVAHSKPTVLVSDKTVKPLRTVPKTSGRLVTEARPVTVGVWDLGAWLGGLIRIVEAVNRAQKTFVFFEVKASVPVGLERHAKAILSWFDDLEQTLTEDRKLQMEHQLDRNVIANDFFEFGEKIRVDLGIDFIVGITSAMVAGYEDGSVYWNHFSTFSNRTILASTYDLRKFAATSARPFETFLAGLIIAQILVAKFYPHLGFHDDRGCLFDYNADRVSMATKISNIQIEPACMRAIDLRYRPAVESLLNLLRNWKD